MHVLVFYPLLKSLDNLHGGLLSSQFSSTSHAQFVPGVCPAGKAAGAWRSSLTPCSPGFEYGKAITIPSLCARLAR